MFCSFADLIADCNCLIISAAGHSSCCCQGQKVGVSSEVSFDSRGVSCWGKTGADGKFGIVSGWDSTLSSCTVSEGILGIEKDGAGGI